MNEADKLLRRGLVLEYLTLGWNVAGVVVAAWSAYNARSVALAGFSLDSLIEIGASLVVVRHLKRSDRTHEGKALRLISFAFLALALYVLVQGTRTLVLQIKPQTSLPGMAWLIATCGAMLALAYGKRLTGIALGNSVLLAESRVTLVDALLAGAILLGLVLNSLLRWWWADPVASFVLVVYGIKEGLHVWKESNDCGH